MSVRDQFTFITRDFHSAWASLAKQSSKTADGRCNFLFANHAMIFLEWCVRVAHENESLQPGVSSRFRDALFRRPEYAVVLPLPSRKRAPSLHAFTFFVGHESTLLWLLFDAIRNGIAHTYWPQRLTLTSSSTTGASLIIAITGVGRRREPSRDRGRKKNKEHLSWFDDGATAGVWFHPGVAFTDIEAAARAAGLDQLNVPTTFDYRPLDLAAVTNVFRSALKQGRSP